MRALGRPLLPLEQPYGPLNTNSPSTLLSAPDPLSPTAEKAPCAPPTAPLLSISLSRRLLLLLVLLLVAAVLGSRLLG